MSEGNSSHAADKPVSLDQPASRDTGRDRRRLTRTIKESLRDVGAQLSRLNHGVSGRLELRDADLECLDLIGRHGPLSPSALAHQARQHPATLTGILDRLERGGWIVRERDPADRRGVVIRAERGRGAEILRLYLVDSGMNTALDQILAGYDEAALALVADFLRRTAAVGGAAAERLAETDHRRIADGPPAGSRRAVPEPPSRS